MQPGLFQWQMEHGEAFLFGRSDWQYVLNTFCFGYRTGYKFVRSAAGATVAPRSATATSWASARMIAGRQGRPALQVESGTLLVRGCEFREEKPQIELGPTVRRAVISDNLFTGPARIANRSRGSVQIANNAGDGSDSRP